MKIISTKPFFRQALSAAFLISISGFDVCAEEEEPAEPKILIYQVHSSSRLDHYSPEQRDIDKDRNRKFVVWELATGNFKEVWIVGFRKLQVEPRLIKWSQVLESINGRGGHLQILSKYGPGRNWQFGGDLDSINGYAYLDTIVGKKRNERFRTTGLDLRFFAARRLIGRERIEEFSHAYTYSYRRVHTISESYRLQHKFTALANLPGAGTLETGQLVIADYLVDRGWERLR